MEGTQLGVLHTDSIQMVSPGVRWSVVQQTARLAISSGVPCLLSNSRNRQLTENLGQRVVARPVHHRVASGNDERLGARNICLEPDRLPGARGRPCWLIDSFDLAP